MNKIKIIKNFYCPILEHLNDKSIRLATGYAYDDINHKIIGNIKMDIPYQLGNDMKLIYAYILRQINLDDTLIINNLKY